MTKEETVIPTWEVLLVSTQEAWGDPSRDGQVLENIREIYNSWLPTPTKSTAQCEPGSPAFHMGDICQRQLQGGTPNSASSKYAKRLP